MQKWSSATAPTAYFIDMTNCAPAAADVHLCCIHIRGYGICKRVVATHLDEGLIAHTSSKHFTDECSVCIILALHVQ